jgi:hypothetical protein
MSARLPAKYFVQIKFRTPGEPVPNPDVVVVAQVTKNSSEVTAKGAVNPTPAVNV